MQSFCFINLFVCDLTLNNVITVVETSEALMLYTIAA